MAWIVRWYACRLARRGLARSTSLTSASSLRIRSFDRLQKWVLHRLRVNLGSPSVIDCPGTMTDEHFAVLPALAVSARTGCRQWRNGGARRAGDSRLMNEAGTCTQPAIAVDMRRGWARGLGWRRHQVFVLGDS